MEGILAKTIVLLVFFKISSAFFFNDGAELSPLCFPQDHLCSCSSFQEAITVTCSAKNLTVVPNFTKISDQIFAHKKYWSIYLNDNAITTVPTRTFSSFQPANQMKNRIYLNFERNRISLIENDAFIDITDMDVAINLTENRITALPSAFRSLRQLTSLALQRNPILTFDSAVVNSMAKSLYYLEIDYKALVSGITDLSVLDLTEMTFYDMNIKFDFKNLTLNFRNSVRNMIITGTELTTLPCVLFDGPYLNYFVVQHATNVSANSVFDCLPGTSLNVFDLEIIFSGLEEFPNILNLTPYLIALSLMENKISNINEKFIPLHNKLEVLNLSYNRLRTIPAVFSRFDHLKFLYIEFNQISIVAPEAVVSSMESLCAGGNPWTQSNLPCNSYFNHPFMDIDNDTYISIYSPCC